MKSFTRLIIPSFVITLTCVLTLTPPTAQAATAACAFDTHGHWVCSVGSGGGGGGFGGFACNASDICRVAGDILTIINQVLVPLLFAVAFIVFLYGVAKKYIFSRGDETAVEEGHKLILWGLIGFVVMISLWGLVNVISNTFGLDGTTAPPLPTSY
jgi:hypothetical protein